MKNSAATLALIALLTAFVGNVAASCRKTANEEMLEYFCEGGQPSDLTTVPETTEKLRITRMPLRRITVDTFSRFGGNLWVLSCEQCEIADIDADAFRRLVNLQQLDLSNNHLTTVKASWLEGLDYLTYLDLNYNNIRDIEDDVYINLPSLVDFRISGNQLRCLNLEEMSHLKELKRIFLNENSEFACPHAVSEFLENQGVAFQPDPEWRKIPSDTIVPPSHAEEDRRTWDSDKRPQQPEVPYIPHARDRTFYPNHDAEHRHRHRRPTTTTVRPRQQQNEIPRVEPRYPSTSVTSSPSSSRQIVVPYPILTPETLPTPPTEWRPLEDIRVMETIGYGPSQTPSERAPTYPQHVPTYETTPYPKDPILERLQVSAVGPGLSTQDDHETTADYDRSSQAGSTLTYPLYVATSNDRERTPAGSIQVTHNSDSDMVSVDSWSTDHSNRYPSGSIQVTHHEYSPPPTVSDDDYRLPPIWSTDTPGLWGTPYYADPRKLIVDESSSTDNVPIVTDPVDRTSRFETTTTTVSNVHYIRPSISSSPELMYSPSSSSGEFGRPYYDTAVTVHPPLQDYRETTTHVNDNLKTTTDEPPPECMKDSANSLSIQSYIAILTMSVFIAVFGHVIAEGF